MSGRLVQRPGPAASAVFTGARLLDPIAGINEVADLVVRDGVIGGDPDGLERVDAAGMVIVPGFVDPHVHLRTPGREDLEDLASGSRAGASGGYVAIAAMPNTQPPVDDAEDLTRLLELAERDAVIPVGMICAITKGQEGQQLTDAAELARIGAVALSDDGVPVGDAAVFRRALQYQHLAGLVLVLHEEDRALSGTGAMHEGAVSARLGVSGIPAVSEAVAVGRDVLLARYESGRIHICHVSARETVDEVRRGKQLGVAVTAEVSPHHLLLIDEDVESLDAATRKMNPPLRGRDDREALIEALLDGTIDCVATDHAPHGASEKEQPFEEAPFGVTGLETAFAALYTELVLTGRVSLEVLVRRMSGDAARVIDLPEPTLAEGAPANLAVIDLEATWTVGADGFVSKSGNSAFLGRELTGRVQATIAGGQWAWRN
ncbi:MAG: dihydroorotase [Actinobacteria bacterium]|nr:dihydroorotase [Thermoleophilia bacterium]MCB9010981.1 dihydroorotase [Actinomycetota bacterium]